MQQQDQVLCMLLLLMQLKRRGNAGSNDDHLAQVWNSCQGLAGVRTSVTWSHVVGAFSLK